MKKLLIEKVITQTENGVYVEFHPANPELTGTSFHAREFSSLAEIDAYAPTAATEIIRSLGIGSEYEPYSQLDMMAEDWINFGTELFKEIKKKIWVINAQAQVTEAEIIALIPSSNLLQKALEGGALQTGKAICEQLKIDLPVYGSVCDFVISEINAKMGA